MRVWSRFRRRPLWQQVLAAVLAVVIGVPLIYGFIGGIVLAIGGEDRADPPPSVRATAPAAPSAAPSATAEPEPTTEPVTGTTVAAAEELADRFERPNNPNLGVAETGQAWSNTGSRPLRIEDGHLVHDAGGAGYAHTTLTGIPRRFGGVVSFVSPGAPGAAIALISTPEPRLTFTTMVHVVVGDGPWYIQVTDSGPANLVSLARGQSSIRADGTPHEVWVWLDGDTVALEIDGRIVGTATSPLVGARSGPLVVWELINTEAQSAPRWESVAATVFAPVGAATGTAVAAAAPPRLDTAGLGMSRADWERTHGQGNQGRYENDKFYVLFAGGRVDHLERSWGDRDAVSVEAARTESRTLIPRDAQFQETYTASGGRTVDRYTSAALDAAMGEDELIVLYRQATPGRVTSIVIATGNNP